MTNVPDRASRTQGRAGHHRPALAPLVPQAVLGNPYPPWQPSEEHDAVHVLEIEARGPRLAAASSHDSSRWTFSAFECRFGGRCRRMLAGES